MGPMSLKTGEKLNGVRSVTMISVRTTSVYSLLKKIEPGNEIGLSWVTYFGIGSVLVVFFVFFE